MNWVDLIIILAVIVFALEGLKRGFLTQAIDIIGLLISLVFALTFYPQGAFLLINIFNLPKIAANPLGFLLIWVFTETIFSALAATILGKLIVKIDQNKFNKYLGIIPSTINALLFFAFVLLFVVSLPIRPDIKKDVFNSKSGSFLTQKAQILEKPFNSVFGPIAKQSLTFLTVKTEEKGSIPLEYTQSEQTVDRQSEQEMFRLVNEERAKYGAGVLVWEENLAKVGRAHSKDMFERGYFSHYSPEGKDVGDRLDEAGIAYSIAGENLALAPNVNRAHTGLMNSEGHRRNILDPAFNKIGIGVIDGGVYGKMFTQVFKD